MARQPIQRRLNSGERAYLSGIGSSREDKAGTERLGQRVFHPAPVTLPFVPGIGNGAGDAGDNISE